MALSCLHISKKPRSAAAPSERNITPLLLSLLFNLLESAAGACGNGDGAFYLQKARMSFIKAHASKPVRQANMREFCGEGGSTAE